MESDPKGQSLADSSSSSSSLLAPGDVSPSPAASPLTQDHVQQPSGGALRAYIGLAILGWGLSILIGAAPHEDPLVGAALALFGAVVVATSRRLPHVTILPAWLVGAAGVAMVVAVAGGAAYFQSGLNLAKAAIVVAGFLLAACAALIAGRTTFPWRDDRVPVATLAAMVFVAIAAPLAVWGAQAAFKHASGSTPIEAFVANGLVLPLAWFLSVLGIHAVAQGQDLLYTTTNGPLLLHVGAACSGIEAMAVFTAVLALFCLIERPGGRALGVWSLVGLVGVYVANLLRLAVVALAGYAWGIDALLRVHAEAGWIFFVAWALLFAWLVRRRTRRPEALVAAAT